MTIDAVTNALVAPFDGRHRKTPSRLACRYSFGSLFSQTSEQEPPG